MATGILGLGSGQAASLNQDLLDKLKAAERTATVVPYETKITNITGEKEVFTNIQTKVSEFLDTVKPLDLFISGGVNAFQQKNATTSGDSVAFDAADISALKNGFTTVSVSQLAQKDVYQSTIFNTANKDANINQGVLNITIGDSKDPLNFDTTNKTYQQLADEITAKSGVNASIEQVGTDSYRLIIKSENTGLSNALAISGTASNALGIGTTDTYQSIALDATTKDKKINMGNLTINGETFDTSNYTYQELADAISAKTGMEASIQQDGATNSYRLVVKSEDMKSSLNISGDASNALGLNLSSNHTFFASQVLEAKNLNAKIDGVAYNIPSNTITLDGLKITANKMGDSSISIVDDNTQVGTQLQNFVTKYNELNTLISTETYSTTSKLADNSAVRDILNQIKTKLFGSYGTSNDKSIFQYGFSLDKTGALSLDTTKLNTALESDISGLKELFIGVAENKGLGTQLKETLDNMNFTGGAISVYSNSMTTRETSLTAEKDKAEASLNARYNQLASQFSDYTAIITQMESSFSGLKMLINQSTSSGN